MSDEPERQVCVIRVGSLAGINAGKVLYRTFVNCDDAGVPFQCSRRGCTADVSRDCYYCEAHLETDFGLVVRPSRILGAGVGLFTTKARLKNERVARYGGEIITPEEMHNRYGWMRNDDREYVQITAPYALDNGDGNSRDAVRIRGAGSYCNDVRGTTFTANAELQDKYICAMHDIAAGEEVYVDYGDEYWTCASPAHFSMSHVTAPISFSTASAVSFAKPRKRRKLCE